MMALSKCVLDRVSERKNKFKDRAYGLVEIISRSVFARMHRRTSVYKDLLDQLVDQVFDMFVHELNEAFRDGCSYGRDLDKEMLESEEVMGNDQNEERDRDTQITGNESNLSELNGQMGSDMIEDDQQIGNYEELSVNVLSGMTNTISNVTTTIEISEDYDDQDEIASQCNEDSSLHSSPTLSQPSSQSQHQNIVQQVSDSGVMSDSVPLSSSPSQASSPQQSIQECKLYKEVDDGEYIENNCDDDVMGSMCTDDQDKEQIEEYDRDDQISANDEKLSLVNGQMDGDGKNDEDDQHGVDQLNVLEHREDIHVADSQEVVPNKSQTGKHVCEQCRISFSSLSDLNHHTRKYTVRKLIKCPWPNCYKAFAQKTDLQVHLESHSEQYKQEKKEEMDNDLHVQENERSGKGSRGNDLNNEQLDGDEDNENAGNNEELTGQVGDDDIVVGVDQLNGHEHRNNNYDGTDVIVDQLGQNISTGNEIVPNMSPTGKHFCQFCGKGFKKRYNLNVHTWTHTGDRPYKCPKCVQTFIRNCNMKQHLKSQHDKSIVRIISKPFLCTWQNCGKAFSKKHHLKHHMFIHTGERHYKCPWKDCNRAFIHSQQRFIHFKVHTDGQPFECPWEDCHDEFVGIRDFRVHTTRVHHEYFEYGDEQLNGLVHRESIKPPKGKHICGHCGKSLISSSKLTVHIRTHTHERPFKCGWNNCKWAFAQKCVRDRHYKTQHSTVLSNMKPNGMANSVSIVPTSSTQPQQSLPLQSIEIKQKYDENEITSQYNEDSLQYSSILFQLGQKWHNYKDGQYVSESEIVTEPVSISTQSQAALPQLVRECKLDETGLERPVKRMRSEEVDGVDAHGIVPLIQNVPSFHVAVSDKPPAGKHVCQDQPHIDNNVDFLSNVQELVGDNADRRNPNDELNGFEHRENSILQVLPKSHPEEPNKSPAGKHVCEHCGKVFKKRSNLTVHIRTLHGQKPFICKWISCNEAFERKIDLQRHQSIHWLAFIQKSNPPDITKR